jgi:hypothetical protein
LDEDTYGCQNALQHIRRFIESMVARFSIRRDNEIIESADDSEELLPHIHAHVNKAGLREYNEQHRGIPPAAKTVTETAPQLE